MAILKLFQYPSLSDGRLHQKRQELDALFEGQLEVKSLITEYCNYVEYDSNLTKEEIEKLTWVLSSGFHDNEVTRTSRLALDRNDPNVFVIEIGPRLNFSSPFSTNAVSICWSIGLKNVKRFERSIRYQITIQVDPKKNLQLENIEKQLVDALHDRMTECRYTTDIVTFDLKSKTAGWKEVELTTKGRKALEEVSLELGLAFDDWDLDFYTDLFVNKLKRNPTTVECFDLAQSNSEHSRHWFFKGRMIIDGKEVEHSLLDMVINTQKHSNDNNVIKFSDNSSAIQGYKVQTLRPSQVGQVCPFSTIKETRHIIFTAETHNFPTGVAPFSGATTGTGGRIRDVQAAGRGAHVVAGTAAYCFGNLNIPGYDLPWEDNQFVYPNNFAKPVDIAVEASNGASDYGNKFGEPILSGFARSFGMKLSNGERREWVKPIMFSGGIGTIDGEGVSKYPPEKGMLVVKIGGPVYRIGVGGGSASSVHVQGDQESELDFGAVQRGDAEMEQKLNRVIRACLERKEGNVILSIHDQGAGGNGNVLKELVEPAGAVIHTNQFQLGDPTISVLELWGAEYQESNAVLVSKKDRSVLEVIANREKCPVSFVGEVTGDGRVILQESKSSEKHPFDLELDCVLGSMPRKEFQLESFKCSCDQLDLPKDITLRSALDRVLRLPSVASKRYLTNKVDRSVTGLVAQQQCVGPLHTPLADVAVIALSHFDTVGSATAIGEQPIKGLLDPEAGARMSVAEALTNLMFAPITCIEDVKCSGNWMWAAKLPGEGAALVQACDAMCKVMSELGVAVDGGKDSLSMAARVGTETVKAPGALVVSVYAPCPDVRKTITPDLKCPDGKGALIRVDLSSDKCRLGGTAIAQCYNQLGSKVADLDDPKLLKKGFEVTQKLLQDNLLTSGHDISDGGLITCILEMAFAGNCGIQIHVVSSCCQTEIEPLFAEEVGWVVECAESNVQSVLNAYKAQNIPAALIGSSRGAGSTAEVEITFNNNRVLKENMADLREIWEETSYQLELRQCNKECALAEFKGLRNRKSPPYKITFESSQVPRSIQLDKTSVAVIREEGSNGDREMVSSLFMAGFQVWDVTMTDLLNATVTLDRFRGVIFPGGFSFADVLGSAKGWAATFLFDPALKSQLAQFKKRKDAFSLGVCNGCQLMALLGWISAPASKAENSDILLTHNASERFESRFTTIRINKSPSIMLKGMTDTVIGVWVAHGEGRFQFKKEEHLSKSFAADLIPLQYVDDEGTPTVKYPFNPNGSPKGVAGMCSEDGRHLAMMPHPERCVLPWQWPYMPTDWKTTMKVSPWLQMFVNAYDWCQTA